MDYCGCGLAFALGVLLGAIVLFVILLMMGASDNDPDLW